MSRDLYRLLFSVFLIVWIIVGIITIAQAF
jgi:hypothetical protein